jgi:hypothetical protein
MEMIANQLKILIFTLWACCLLEKILSTTIKEGAKERLEELPANLFDN